MTAEPTSAVLNLPSARRHATREAAPTQAHQTLPQRGPWRLAAATICSVATVAGAWAIAWQPLYRPGSAIGYALGVTGGVMMLALLLYPLRKRLRLMQNWGRLKHWFMAHMIGGALGPLLILFHASFRFGSFNAGVALGSMLLVVISGMVGRFLYRHIHRGLYGCRSSLQEAQATLTEELRALEPGLQGLPQLRSHIQAFLDAAATAPPHLPGRLVHALYLGPRRISTSRLLRRTAGSNSPAHPHAAPTPESLDALLRAIDRTLAAAQQAAHFATYEQLFALWHVVHIPFLCLLAITAVVHVVAVHAY